MEVPSNGNPAEMLTTVIIEKGSVQKNPVWRFVDEDEKKRFQNLVNTINSSGVKLLNIFQSIANRKVGYLTVGDITDAMKMMEDYAQHNEHEAEGGGATTVDEEERAARDKLNTQLNKEVRSMMMLGIGMAMSNKSKAESSLVKKMKAEDAGMAGMSAELSLDFSTFFELFASAQKPINSLQECLAEWRSKLIVFEGASTRDIASGQTRRVEDIIKTSEVQALLSDFSGLLPGESIISPEIIFCSYRIEPIALEGIFLLTNYRIILLSNRAASQSERYRMPESFEQLHVPLMAVTRVEKDEFSSLTITCKDLRVISNLQFKNSPSFDAYAKIHERAFDATRTFAHRFFPLYKPDLAGEIKDGWHIYEPKKEFTRQGLLDCHADEMKSPTWKLVDNTDYKKSPTYPGKFLIPTSFTVTKNKSIDFRSKKRMPAVTWQNWQYPGAVLARSAQPMVGLSNKRSKEDEQLISLYRCRGHAESSEGGTTPDGKPFEMYIFDCRKSIAATGNKVQGKGVENIAHYKNCKLYYGNIGNIHTMRNSLADLADISVPSGSALTETDGDWLSNLENAGWLEHVRLVLEFSVKAAEKLHLEGASVLVHCSDGWDRTAQVCATAQLLLDPYYRTIEGFAVLVEKDWCAFGYKFQDRCGHNSVKENQERSPIFVQWLDVIHQIQSQFPDVFEYDSRLLVFVADHLFSGLFGTFLGNSEKIRFRELRCRERTCSIWTYVLANVDNFKSRNYVKDNGLEQLWPSYSIKNIQLWARYYQRWDQEVHPRYGKGSIHAWVDDWGKGPIVQGIELDASGQRLVHPVSKNDQPKTPTKKGKASAQPPAVVP
uniref:Myotubularin phosphatase domain-containing protein n=1 Tax=Octactis speculum TaxID=3111310 RepID=A0A7S2CT85_9STRA